jgi:fructose-bisphosphate aldolase, class I
MGAHSDPRCSVEAQRQKIKNESGFIAALDQSGGSTPKALALYGVQPDAWKTDEEMYLLVHAMRARIITSPAFSGRRLIGAILFEDTMDREILGKFTPDYLWDVKGVVPFLKVDKGLQDERDGVQLMKPMPELGALLVRARSKHVFGTKMRSVIKQANRAGIDAVVAQQFEVGEQILAAGLVPIIEPEIDIKCPDKKQAETLLQASLLAALDRVSAPVMLKVTLPEVDDHYQPCVAHRNVLKVVALSGGYPLAESNARLSRNHGVVASFSRALAEGLDARQSQPEFDAALDRTIESIWQASRT